MSKRRRNGWDDANSYDRYDGSRYIGFHRREYNDSRFGTYPSHDPYNENSFADEEDYSKGLHDDNISNL